MVAFKYTIQHSPNLQIFAKNENNIESRIWPQIDGTRRVVKNYSAFVRFSSEFVEISSELVEISSELVEISSELVKTSLELMIISTFRKTTKSDARAIVAEKMSTI